MPKTTPLPSSLWQEESKCTGFIEVRVGSFSLQWQSDCSDVFLIPHQWTWNAKSIPFAHLTYLIQVPAFSVHSGQWPLPPGDTCNQEDPWHPILPAQHLRLQSPVKVKLSRNYLGTTSTQVYCHYPLCNRVSSELDLISSLWYEECSHSSFLTAK